MKYNTETRIATLEQAILDLEARFTELCRDVAGMAEANAERNAVADNKFVQVEQFRFMWGHEQALHEVKQDLDREAAMNEALFGKDNLELNVEEWEAWAKENADAVRAATEGKPTIEGKQVDRNGKWPTPRSLYVAKDMIEATSDFKIQPPDRGIRGSAKDDVFDDEDQE